MYQTNQYEGMLSETVVIRGANGDLINAYVAKPLGPGTLPRHGADPSPAGLG